MIEEEALEKAASRFKARQSACEVPLPKIDIAQEAQERLEAALATTVEVSTGGDFSVSGYMIFHPGAGDGTDILLIANGEHRVQQTELEAQHTQD